jgi:hypothetical protein
MTDDMNNVTGQEQQPVVGNFDLRHLSAAQLAQLGLTQVAYVKPVLVNGARAFAIHAADGTPMALAESCALAIAAINQHDMFAALVH